MQNGMMLLEKLCSRKLHACPLGHSKRPALRPLLGQVLLLVAPPAIICPNRLPITAVLPLTRAVWAKGIGLILSACWFETQGCAHLSMDALLSLGWWLLQVWRVCDTTHSSVLAREEVCAVSLGQVDNLTIHPYCLAQGLAGSSLLRKLAITIIRHCKQQCSFHETIVRFLLNTNPANMVVLSHFHALEQAAFCCCFYYFFSCLECCSLCTCLLTHSSLFFKSQFKCPLLSEASLGFPLLFCIHHDSPPHPGTTLPLEDLFYQ